MPKLSDKRDGIHANGASVVVGGEAYEPHERDLAIIALLFAILDKLRHGVHDYESQD